MVILACWALIAGGSALAQPTSAPAAAVLGKDDLPPLLRDLNHPDWRTREAASEALMYAGTEAYDSLKVAFKDASAYEVRRRIRAIVHEIYMTQAVGKGPAFLGIRIGGYSDVRVTPGIAAVAVNGVVELTAAERAGLRAGDLIAALNDQPLSPDFFASGLTGWIAAQKPGSRARVGVLRGGRGMTVSRPADTDTRRALGELKVTSVSHEADPRIPPACTGLRVEAPLKLDENTELAPGDLIVGLDAGMGLPAIMPKSAKDLSDWAKAENVPPAGGAVPVPGRIMRPGARAPAFQPTLYALRGGEWMDLTVTLGHVPDRAMASNFERAERLKAEAAFELWWQQTFDPEGLVAENKGATDPSWRLTPQGKQR